MNSKRIRTFVLAAAVTALVGSGAFAQVDPAPAVEPGGSVTTPAQTSAETPTLAQTSPNQSLNTAQTTTTAPRNDGFDWGWIGLVGLIGLAGLRRSEPEVRHVDRDATYPAKRTDGTTAPLGGAR